MNAPLQYKFAERRICAREGCGIEFAKKIGKQIYCDITCMRAAHAARERKKYRETHDNLRKTKSVRVPVKYGAELDPMELDILRWMSIGKDDELIAEIMGISLVTVRRWVTDAKIKLGAESRAHAVAMVLRAGHAAEMAALRAELDKFSEAA